jgi:hypothetical protein
MRGVYVQDGGGFLLYVQHIKMGKLLILFECSEGECF